MLRQAISQHLNSCGPRGWSTVRERFPEISNATFWRHVKAVRDVPPATATQPSYLKPRTEDDSIRLFPSFFEPMKKLAELERLLPEAEEMGRQARNPQGKIINWRMHAKSLEMRRELLREQIAAAQQLVDLGKMQRLYDAVVDIVATASPNLVKEVGERLVALQKSLAAET
jgi:hypothetical protein